MTLKKGTWIKNSRTIHVCTYANEQVILSKVLNRVSDKSYSEEMSQAPPVRGHDLWIVTQKMFTDSWSVSWNVSRIPTLKLLVCITLVRNFTSHVASWLTSWQKRTCPMSKSLHGTTEGAMKSIVDFYISNSNTIDALDKVTPNWRVICIIRYGIIYWRHMVLQMGC